MVSKAKILCVDDEPNVLEGLALQLRRGYQVHTAVGGPAGLASIESEGPFAVVLSDMRMPEMDGAAFLKRVREIAPDTTRMLLTGQTDMKSAIEAVNCGQLFRFLTKPCPRESLHDAMEAAVEQHRLVTSQKELLDQTLKGAVAVLTEVLSLAAPAAFSRSETLRGYVAHAAERLGLDNAWELELAAMLAHLGCITLPPDLLNRHLAGQPLNAVESKMIAEHPETGHRLLTHIPRLGAVAEMIRFQQRPGAGPEGPVRLGAELVRTSMAVDALVAKGHTVAEAVGHLGRQGGFDRKLLAALSYCQLVDRGDTVVAVRIHELTPFMTLDEDVRAVAGNVVLTKGRKLNAPTIERLRNFARGTGLIEPVRVRVARSPGVAEG